MHDCQVIILDPSPQTISVDVLQSFEKIDRAEWDDFVLSVGGDLYVTHDWCRIWWKHYGQGRTLRLFVFRHRGAIVGLAPMFFEQLRLGPASIKIAKRVGSDFAMTVFSLPMRKEYAGDMFWRLIVNLTEDDHCDAVGFGPMPGNDPTLEELRESVPDHATVIRDTPAWVHTVFRLPTTLKAYLDSLDGKQRQNYRRRLKLLNQSFAVRTDVVRTAASFTEFQTAHDAQWKADGKLGHFDDWPKAREFNAELVERMPERLRVTRIFANENPVASQFSFVFGDCCYWRLVARTPDTDFDRFGLGVLGMVDLFDKMIGEGIHRVEAGIGHYSYKTQFGGNEMEIRSFIVASLRSEKKVKAFLKTAEIFHILYYQLWFKRLSPRIRLQRTLWPTWIRSRIS